MSVNWKIVGVLSAVAVAVVVFAPPVGSRFLPLLLVAVCPLSMILMMRGMSAQGRRSRSSDEPSTEPQADDSSRKQRLDHLNRELAETHARQEAIALEIERLQPSDRTQPVETVWPPQT